MEIYDKRSRKIVKSFIKHTVKKDSVYDIQDEFLQCLSKTLKTKTASIINFEKQYYLTSPSFIITIKKVKIDGDKIDSGLLLEVNKQIKLKGKAILFFHEKKPFFIESPYEKEETYKKDIHMIFNEMIQRKKLLVAKTTVEEKDDEFIAKTIISARPESKIDAFEIFEAVATDSKVAKKQAVEKAVKHSVLLKLPLEKISIKLSKYDPISELNEAALQNKIGVSYEFDGKQTSLTLSKKIGQSVYFDPYTAKGDKKSSKIAVAEQALKKSGFLSRVVKEEKVEKLKKELPEDEEERLEAILELSEYVPFEQYYDTRLLKEIKKMRYIPAEEIEKMGEKELGKRKAQIEEDVEKLVEKAQPKKGKVYYKVAKLKKELPTKSSKMKGKLRLEPTKKGFEVYKEKGKSKKIKKEKKSPNEYE